MKTVKFVPVSRSKYYSKSFNSFSDNRYHNSGEVKPLSSSESFDGSAPVVPAAVSGRIGDGKKFQSSEKLNLVIFMHSLKSKIYLHRMSNRLHACFMPNEEYFVYVTG
jgi:hypothetical protein